MQIERYKPPKDLYPYFREYYSCAFHSDGSALIPVVDDGCHDLVFFREQNSFLQYGDSRSEWPVREEVFTILGDDPPYRIQLNSSLSFFTIKLQPWWNTDFFPDHDIRGVIPVSQFLGGHTQDLHHLLFSDLSNIEKFKRTDMWLRERLKKGVPEPDILVEEICSMIYKRRGKITVQVLEAYFGHSRQYLNTRFKSKVAYTLKNFILKVRILDLIKERVNTPTRSFTQLAHEYDYFDQAHFNRDFKKVTGLTPGKFFDDLAPFLERHKQ